MEKFITGAALGMLAGALLTANNYKMRTLVRKGQEEVASKLDQMLDEKIELLEKGAKKVKKQAEEKVEEIEEIEEEKVEENSAQFDVSDRRTLDEVVRWLMELGYIPSFCTACYREGRTGDRFMSLCKSGQIQNCCHPNALMTLEEYLVDYASPKTREIGEKVIEKELLNIPKEKVRKIAAEHIEDIKNNNKRDFRF